MIAFAADHVLDGGGLANYSASVAVVGATGAIGIYDVPKVDVTTVAMHSRGVHRRLDARLRHAADHDGAGGAGRRSGGRAAARSDRVPPPQCAQDRRPDDDRQSLHRLGPHARDPRQARAASDLARPGRGEGRGRRGHRRRHRRRLRRPRTMAPAPIARSARSRSIPRAASRSMAIASRWATASEPLWPTAWQVISAAIADAGDRGARSTCSTRSSWSTLRRPLHDERRPRRTRPQEIRAGCRRSAPRPAHPAAPMSAPRRWRRRHASCSASACGRRRSSCGASRRAIRARSSGTRPSGRTSSSCMSGLPPLPLPAIAAKAHAENGVTGAMAHAFSRWAWSQATFPIGAARTGPPTSTRSRVRHGAGAFSRLDRTRRRLSADRLQPDRHRLHVALRHAGARRDRARDRGAAHRQGLQRARMRPGAGSGGGARAGAGRLRHGRRLCAPRDPAALRGRPRQRAMEPRRLSRRPRLRPAAARSRDRGAAAAIAQRGAEGHGGGGDDPGRSGAPQRHLRRHRPPFPGAAGDRRTCSREHSRDRPSP